MRNIDSYSLCNRFIKQIYFPLNINICKTFTFDNARFPVHKEVDNKI